MTVGLLDLFSLSCFSFLVTELEVEGGQTNEIMVGKRRMSKNGEWNGMEPRFA
jgi:hypothetical protein